MDEGVSGLAIGDVLVRLVGRTLQEFARGEGHGKRSITPATKYFFGGTEATGICR